MIPRTKFLESQQCSKCQKFQCWFLLRGCDETRLGWEAFMEPYSMFTNYQMGGEAQSNLGRAPNYVSDHYQPSVSPTSSSVE